MHCGDLDLFDSSVGAASATYATAQAGMWAICGILPQWQHVDSMSQSVGGHCDGAAKRCLRVTGCHSKSSRRGLQWEGDW